MAPPPGNTNVYGVISGVLSSTSGTMLADNGETYSYNDASLATRGITFELGERVIGDHNGSGVIYINPLSDLNEYGEEYANRELSLTSEEIRVRLQVMNCCAAKKGVKYIDSLITGKDCENYFYDAEIMMNHIDALVGVTPEGEKSGGSQASYMFIITSIGGGLKTVSITIGNATYALNSTAATKEDFATEIVNYINNLYPDSYQYKAVAYGDNVVFAGVNYDEDNDVSVLVSGTNFGIITPSVLSLQGGIAPKVQPDNCITNNDIEIIIGKLKTLCSEPCEEIVNFTQ
jgi:hypothetical protein